MCERAENGVRGRQGGCIQSWGSGGSAPSKPAAGADFWLFHLIKPDVLAGFLRFRVITAHCDFIIVYPKMRSHCKPRPRTRANNGPASNTHSHSNTAHVHVDNTVARRTRKRGKRRGHSCSSGCVGRAPPPQHIRRVRTARRALWRMIHARRWQNEGARPRQRQQAAAAAIRDSGDSGDIDPMQRRPEAVAIRGGSDPSFKRSEAVVIRGGGTVTQCPRDLSPAMRRQHNFIGSQLRFRAVLGHGTWTHGHRMAWRTH